MLNETTDGTVLVPTQAIRVRRAGEPMAIGTPAPDADMMAAAHRIPDMTSVRQQDGGLVVTTHSGGQVVVSRSPLDGHVVLTPVGARTTTTAQTVSPADFMPPKYVVDGALTGLAMICATVFLAPVLRYMLRRRERTQASVPAATDPRLHQRLDRIEQAIDAIALEVERSAEAQRYSARLLTERMAEPAVAMSATGESLAVRRRAAHPHD